MRRLLATALICAGALGLLPAAAGAAAASPAWTIEAVPYPSAFEAGSAYDSEELGPVYLVQAYNTGGAATTGTFTLTDTLPKGLLPAGASFPPKGFYGPESAGETPSRSLSCSALGRKITCVGGSEGPVGPGEAVTVVVPLQVEASAAGTLIDKAAIEGGGAGAAEASTQTPISTEPRPFGFVEGPGLYGLAGEADGTEARLAGSHPYALTVAGMNLTTNPNAKGFTTLLPAGGGLREAKVELPRGIVVDPQATPQCRETELESGEFGCPPASQVGTITLVLAIYGAFGNAPTVLPLYNMVPPGGYAAELGFRVTKGTYEHLLGSVSSDGSFTLTADANDILARVPINGVRTTLWGEPTAQSHDAQRSECIFSKGERECPVERTRKAFLTMPAACSGPLTTFAHIGSWLGEVDTDGYTAPQAIEGCDSLRFEPTIAARPSTQQADSPAGLGFDLRQPQNDEYEDETGNPQRGTAPLENTTVTLPAGMVLNPSAANGREACTSAQVGLATAVGQMPIRYREEPAKCPNASKVGTAEVDTPLLDHSLPGSIYLAKPFDNPFGSLLAIYLVVEDERSGIIAKLAGKVEPDLSNGQLRTTFTESPQLPLEDVHLDFFSGSRAALTTPLTCGEKTTTGLLTPWSSPNPTSVMDAFQITSTPGGGSCPASEAEASNSRGFSAGTTEPVAGSYSPFVLKVVRADGSQRIEKVDATLPDGLTGRLAGIPYCSEAQIAQARSRSNPEEGKLERQSPSCPQASEVGTVTVGAGSGSDPFYATGHAYLAGPYKGAALSMVVVTPAIAGPFDLGVVVVRIALELNLETAQIHAVSDPLPTILQGIPLDVRSIALNLDRPQFTINPTDCTAQPLTATVTSPAGATAVVSERFGVEGCNKLAFHPKVAISLKGGTKRAAHPALRAVVTYPKKGAYANIARAQVGLPHSEFLDQNNLNKVCTQPQLRSDTCPAKSIYGHAKAWTPLLDKPLEGPVYLGVGFGYKLPALVADLNGQVRILLKGKVDTTKKHGIRNTFEAVPDAPVSRFVLEMKGGKKYGLLENSENICSNTQRANARFIAQNGRVAQLHPKIGNSCKKHKPGHHKKGHNKKGGRHNKAGNHKHG